MLGIIVKQAEKSLGSELAALRELLEPLETGVVGMEMDSLND
jgi:hypothetical protein